MAFYNVSHLANKIKAFLFCERLKQNTQIEAKVTTNTCYVRCTSAMD